MKYSKPNFSKADSKPKSSKADEIRSKFAKFRDKNSSTKKDDEIKNETSYDSPKNVENNHETKRLKKSYEKPYNKSESISYDKSSNKSSDKSSDKSHDRNHVSDRRSNNYSDSGKSASFAESRLKGVFEIDSRRGKRLYTKNLIPGKKVYDENIFFQSGVEYREWNPSKSKLGAAIAKGVSQIGIMPGKTVLYLGCSTGTTCSHVSDILGPEGKLFGLDFSPRVMREFVFLSEDRPNIAPIMADAFHPEHYQKYIPEKVDVIFQDVAQRNQVDIFLKNCEIFLSDSGYGIFAVKARSIDVTRNPKDIFAECKKVLESRMLIVDYRDLYPYEKDHCIFVVKKK